MEGGSIDLPVRARVLPRCQPFRRSDTGRGVQVQAARSLWGGLALWQGPGEESSGGDTGRRKKTRIQDAEWKMGRRTIAARYKSGAVDESTSLAAGLR